MDISSQVSSITGPLSEWLGEQGWYQELKTKWDELDPQSRTYLQITGAILSTALLLYMIFSFVWGVHSLRNEVNTKSEILLSLQSASEELKKLQAVNVTLSGAGVNNDPWPTYFESTAAPIGITKSNLTLSESKAGPANDMSKEVLFDLSVKKVNIHQMVRFAYALENGARPVKLRNLVINTEPDMSGYLDATLSVSAFTINTPAPAGK
jgi:hypothetical protein